jgi:beta-galactosidase
MKNFLIIKKYFVISLFINLVLTLIVLSSPGTKVRSTENFGKNWKFNLGDIPGGQEPGLNDSEWRELNLPHDWSVEGKFSKDNPATPGGGALPGGIGWYRKSFTLSNSDKEKIIYIDFDGVYRNSEVWINGNYLGKRPYGYSSFRYELTPYLKFGNEKNIIAVKVDNSKQPNSRWYSGSGIYRNVWIIKTGKIAVDHWGTFITTPEVNLQTAEVRLQVKIKNAESSDQNIVVKTIIYDESGKKLKSIESNKNINSNSVILAEQKLAVEKPVLWSDENPYLYKAVTSIEKNNKVVDIYETNFGIRTFYFDIIKGFILNGKSVKIKGVCNHHDLGFLGAAINTRALERQLEILKEMGCNGIRTSHNPPAPELLDLCDKKGFIVMDEAFDMWKKGKTDFDYSLDWDEWHEKDLSDIVIRDRNHPSVFIWSIGNEIIEQWDSTGIPIAKELVGIVKKLDDTRPVTSNMNDPQPKNYIYRSGALDLVGFSYHQQDFISFPDSFPHQKFIGSETTSALATRGYYDMPSDSIRRWPERWDKPFEKGNPDNTCSSYDNCSAPWGSTHEESWRLIKKYDFLSGMYIWTGFDYLGEPTPYSWPSRSSYFGIVDLAGFPKDAFYLYQAEWTNKPVLHIFPHWNWKEGQTIDVWAYTNCDEVELFLNGESQGIKKKSEDELHLMWRIKFKPGTLKAVGKKEGKEILTSEVKTAGVPAKIVLVPDKKNIKTDGNDLCFITVKVLDKNGTLVPDASNLIHFTVTGQGKIIGVDNGLQTSDEFFKANMRKAFNGLCLAVVQSDSKHGKIKVTAESEGLKEVSIFIDSK